MWKSNIWTDFSTLLMLDAGKPASDFGVHDANVVTTTSTNAGLSLTREAQLFRIAEIKSMFLSCNRVEYARVRSFLTDLLKSEEHGNHTFDKLQALGF